MGEGSTASSRTRASHRRRPRATLAGVLFTLVVAVAVTPFATAGADTSAAPTSSEATGGPSHATRLSAADDIAPNADPEPGTLVINAGGDRVGGAIAGASGAVFSIFTDAALTVPATPATCGPTDANGVCSVSLPPGTFYAVETTAPPGYQTLPQLATDPNDTTRDYTNNIGPITITSGNTSTLPDNTGLSTTDFNYSSGKYANRRVNPPLLVGRAASTSRCCSTCRARSMTPSSAR